MSALSIHLNIRIHSLTVQMHPQMVKILLFRCYDNCNKLHCQLIGV